ncbi:hypothetical protein [Candidatus Magnetobacterium casense]|uniref:hypothetical protein n=1 Tax=Candidatus Magnetobacterium casense TaxID=1455061 RepID=UPI00058DCCFF|nr:hypothetical protein [Candidatus Magnetobacterium casensis]
MDDNIGILDATLPALTAKFSGYREEDLVVREPLELNEEAYLDYLKSVVDVYPFLAITGLRVLTESMLRRICEEKQVALRDKPTLGTYVNALHKADQMKLSDWKDMLVFSEFENIASHGYKISPETAQWALEAIPAMLKTL